MRDLAVQQPHLGREAIGLLVRIVAAQDAGLAQDDIEPYLLVRLLRCGYIRRRAPRAGVFVATPAGSERSRQEVIAARRQQDELDRREIIRGRLQAMAARLELDQPAAPPALTLRDYGLPEIHQRQRRALPEPVVPAIRRGRLRSAHGDRLVAMRDNAQRATPEDALALIRESEKRATRELPVTIAFARRRCGVCLGRGGTAWASARRCSRPAARRARLASGRHVGSCAGAAAQRDTDRRRRGGPAERPQSARGRGGKDVLAAVGDGAVLVGSGIAAVAGQATPAIAPLRAHGGPAGRGVTPHRRRMPAFRAS